MITRYGMTDEFDMEMCIRDRDRGVHIRLLVDVMESWIDMEGNPYFYGLSSHENVEIKLYNKANPLKPWKMMGRKMCIRDSISSSSS